MRLKQRLVQVEGTAAQPDGLIPTDPPPMADESTDLAVELAAAFARKVEGYREYYQLSVQEALDRSTECSPQYDQHALTCPPDQVSWCSLEAIAKTDPEKARQRWEAVKQAARSELRNGYRAARTLEAGDSHCWQRARFLALRSELADAWRPRDALELQLIDHLAQYQTLMERWQEILSIRTMLAGSETKRAAQGKSPYEPPRVSDSEATAEAAGMIERFHRLYLCTLRALQAQRRLGPAVIVRRAGQVNVAHQQINVAR